jgi:hypothetical protein
MLMLKRDIHEILLEGTLGSLYEVTGLARDLGVASGEAQFIRWLGAGW